MVSASCKQELGWTDYRFTNFQHIERWWEIIFCVYTMISLNSPAWIHIFPNSNLLLGFNQLISAMNQFKPCYASG
jgi:hypothetical protein